MISSFYHLWQKDVYESAKVPSAAPPTAEGYYALQLQPRGLLCVGVTSFVCTTYNSATSASINTGWLRRVIILDLTSLAVTNADIFSLFLIA